VPSLIWCEAISCDTNLRGHNRLELIVGDFQKGQKLPDQDTDVALVDERKAKVKSSSSDTDIRVSQAVEDCVSVSLNSIWFYGHDFDQCVECDVSNVVVSVGQEFAKNVHAENAETRISFNVKNGENGLVEDGVSDIFG
jgi:hypothetical protein